MAKRELDKKAESQLAVAVVAYLSNTSHQGHCSYCEAICGPEYESWIEPEKCNCERKTLVTVLGEMGVKVGI